MIDKLEIDPIQVFVQILEQSIEIVIEKKYIFRNMKITFNDF